MSTIRVILADDHPALLEGLGTVLEVKYPEIEVVGAVSDGAEAVRLAEELGPDIVLMDIKMPRVSGTEATRQIKRRLPNTRVVMLTTFDDRELISDAMNAGANGYILKETPIDAIAKAIKAAHEGNVLISEKVIEKLASGEPLESRDATGAAGLSRANAGGQTGEGNPRRETPNVHGRIVGSLGELTKREGEIYRLMVHGMTNSEIAATLNIREKTVRNHVHRIYDIIGVHNRTQAVLWGMEHGIG